MAVKKRRDQELTKRLMQKARRLIIFLLAVAVVIYSFQAAEKLLCPALSSSAEFKTRMVIEEVVHQSVYDVSERVGKGDADLISTSLDENGKISLVTLNTNMLNLIGTEIAQTVNADISEGKTYTAYVNPGSIFRSRIVSQLFPNIPFKVVPTGISEVRYTTEFEEAGINQTKYKVFINIDTEARLRIPFMTERVYAENTVLIAEAVIVGDVPDTYADITQDEVSDYIN